MWVRGGRAGSPHPAGLQGLPWLPHTRVAGASCFLSFVTRLDTSLLLDPRAVLGWAMGMATALVLMAGMEGNGVQVRSQKPHGLPRCGNAQFISPSRGPGAVPRAYAAEACVTPSPVPVGRNCHAVHAPRLQRSPGCWDSDPGSPLAPPHTPVLVMSPQPVWLPNETLRVFNSLTKTTVVTCKGSGTWRLL